MTRFQPVSFGKYVLLERIGVGPTGEWYRALVSGKEDTERPVLIKKIHPQLTADEASVHFFEKAARVSRLLQHPNVIQVYDYGCIDNTYYLASEYISGRSLQETLDSSKEQNCPIELKNAVHIAEEICNGLQYAHTLKDSQGNPLNIIHRNISPTSVFVSFQGQVKITEFALNSTTGQENSGQMAMLRGTIAYMSPEQVGGNAIDRLSDIFSTGILLYEMVTGIPLFDGKTMEVFSRVRQAQFVRPEKIAPNLPLSVCHIINRALEKAPENRYQSAAEMRAALQKVMCEIASRPADTALAQYMKNLFDQSKPGDMLPNKHPLEPEPAPVAKDAKVPQDPMIPTTVLTDTTRTPEQGETAQSEPGRLTAHISSGALPEKNNPMTRSRQNQAGSSGTKIPQSKDSQSGLQPISPDPHKAQVFSGSDVQPPTTRAIGSTSSCDGDTNPGQKAGTSMTRPPGLKKPIWIAATATIAIIVLGFSIVVTMQKNTNEPVAGQSSSLIAGQEALRAGHYKEAVSLFDEAMASEPDLIQTVSPSYAEALEGWADQFVKTDLDKAKGILLLAVKFDPESVSALSELGLLYLRQNDYDNAAKAYERVAKLDDSIPDTFFNLGYIYALTQDFPKAEQMYGRVVALAPPFVDEALFNLAIVQERIGKRDQCVKNLKLALKVNPKNRQARQYLERLKG